MYTLFAGPPGDISDMNINEITARSFTVKWNELSSNDLCGSVWHSVAVTVSKGGITIVTFTRLNNYTVTGLNGNTSYNVSVAAYNNAGNSNATSVMTMTNNNGKSVIDIDKSPFA